MLIWNHADRHSQSLASLRNPLADRIARALAAPGQPPIPADQDVRCLACHASVSVVKGREPTLAWNSMGVGCEACHGQPEKWISQHYAWRASKSTDLRDRYREHNMNWLGDPIDRARACVGCHVGSPPTPIAGSEATLPARDVNHDLIAAGHPRLDFDLDVYLRAMPPHWTENSVDADRHVRQWAAGVWESTRAALELTHFHALSAGDAPWPELADWQCFACHQNLHDRKESPAASPTQSAKPGQPAWAQDRWSLFPAVSSVMSITDQPPPELLDRFQKQLALWNPDRDAVRDHTRELVAWIDAQPAVNPAAFDHTHLQTALRETILRRLDRPDPLTWNELAQFDLAFQSLAADSRLTPNQSAALNHLHIALNFPKQTNSPTRFRLPPADAKSLLKDLLSTPSVP
jgi:hypothetical protein